MEDLYKNIKARRLELGMSQEELAQKVGYTSRSTIARIERGDIDLPQSKILDMAKALKVTPSYLMGWEEEEPYPEVGAYEVLWEIEPKYNYYPMQHYTTADNTQHIEFSTVICGKPCKHTSA